MPGPLDLLREYAALGQRRRGEGLSPLEYQRWLDLGHQLDRAFPQRPRRRPGSTRLRVEFASREELRRSVMMEVRPIGLFVPTPFAPEVGARLELALHVLETGERVASRVEVVSANVGPGFSTAALGMGVRFRDPECPLRTLLEELCGGARRQRTARRG